MNKLLLVMIGIALLIPIVSAGDTTLVGQNITIFATHPLAFSGYFTDVTAYVSVLYPNGSQAILSQVMIPSSDIPGTFSYNYTPDDVGTFYTTTQFYNGTEDIGTGSDTFYVYPPEILEETNMPALGVIVAIGIAIALFAYMAFAFKSEDKGTTVVWRMLSLIFIVLLLVLLAWTAIDSNQACAFLQDGTGYEYVCEEGPATAGTWMLRLFTVVMVIFFMWLLVSLLVTAVNHLRGTNKI